MYEGQPMQRSKVAGIRDDATASSDRTFGRIGPISNRIRTIGFSNLLAVGNLDRGWLVALVWTLGTKVEGEIKLLARFGIVLYWCSLAIAFACSIAATIILMAIIRGELSGSEVWMAAEFFVAVGVVAVGVSRGGFSFMKHLARWLPRARLHRNKPSAAWSSLGLKAKGKLREIKSKNPPSEAVRREREEEWNS
jgi:hypothetical protein